MINTSGLGPRPNETNNKSHAVGRLATSSFFMFVSDGFGVLTVCRLDGSYTPLSARTGFTTARYSAVDKKPQSKQPITLGLATKRPSLLGRYTANQTNTQDSSSLDLGLAALNARRDSVTTGQCALIGRPVNKLNRRSLEPCYAQSIPEGYKGDSYA